MKQALGNVQQNLYYKINQQDYNKSLSLRAYGQRRILYSISMYGKEGQQRHSCVASCSNDSNQHSEENIESPQLSLSPATDLQGIAKNASKFLIPLVLIALIVGARFSGIDVQEIVQSLEHTVETAGPLGPFLFVCVYTLLAVLLVPATVLTLAAGYLFGPVLGVTVVSFASTQAATIAFLLARYIARPYATQALDKNPQFKAIDAAIGDQGWRLVALLRLSPLFPYGVLNYLLGLSKINLLSFVVASWAGMLPGTIAYVYIGSAGKDALQAATGAQQMELYKLGLYGLGAVATLLVTVLISRLASKAIDEVKQSYEHSTQNQSLLDDQHDGVDQHK